jgi:hypothetical protein
MKYLKLLSAALCSLVATSPMAIAKGEVKHDSEDRAWLLLPVTVNDSDQWRPGATRFAGHRRSGRAAMRRCPSELANYQS